MRNVTCLLSLWLLIACGGSPEDSISESAAKVQEHAKKGNPLAQFQLAQRLRTGDGLPKDPSQAVEWYRKAAKQGMPEAQHNLGVALDHGQGIAEDDLTHIFDPFFTTKPPGEGTGLGLHLARTILDECSGNISVVSEEGIGSTFTIDFPISEGYVVPVTTYEKNEADLQTSPT